MSKSKKVVKSIVQLVIPISKANGGPPVATALGPRGVNPREFCDRFKAMAATIIEESNKQNIDCKIDNDTPIKALVKIYEDKKFDIEIKGIPTTYFLKKYAGIEKGSGLSKREASKGSITMTQCREIAQIQLPYMNTEDLQQATSMIASSASSMNIPVIEG